VPMAIVLVATTWLRFVNRRDAASAKKLIKYPG
jgi:hypothetical protein